MTPNEEETVEAEISRLKELIFTEELKAEWIQKLRSNEYKQTEKTLRRVVFNGTKHCCLGVLGECIQYPFELMNTEAFAKGTLSYVNNEDGKTANIVLDALTQEVLYQMNDKLGKNFLEIADFIEKEIPAVSAGLATTAVEPM